MSSFEKLTLEELKMLAEARSINRYENMSRQQVESIFTRPSTPKSTSKPALKPKKPTPFLKPKKHEPTSITIDEEFEKSEMEKTRPLGESTWYKWYDWLIDHIPESVKKSASNIKEKIMNLFPKDYKPKD